MSSDDLTAKLKTFAMLLKFGHDLFDSDDISKAGAKAVNDSRILLKFNNSALFEITHEHKAVLIAQFAQTEAHPHAESAVKQKRLAEKIQFDTDGFAVMSRNTYPEADFMAENSVYLACKLESPVSSEEKFTFIWFLEYENEIPDFVRNTAKLMGKSIAETLSLLKFSGKNKQRIYHNISKKSRYIIAGVLFLLCLFIPVRENTNAEFMLKPDNISAAYAWFDGQIAQCLKQEGEYVRKGEIIARYDTAKLEYQLANARSALLEAQADLELEQQNSFTDENKLGKVKLLRAKCDTMQVAVKEAQWFLDHSAIRSPSDGILSLTDERAEQLSGKAVRTGDKLFEIYAKNKIIAEIMVNEHDASILHKNLSVNLYLYTSPENGINAEVIDIAQYPKLTEQNTYCYPVTASLENSDKTDLRFGMRGIAKLSGNRVTLAYYLFKNLILYFRKW